LIYTSYFIKQQTASFHPITFSKRFKRQVYNLFINHFVNISIKHDHRQTEWNKNITPTQLVKYVKKYTWYVLIIMLTATKSLFRLLKPGIQITLTLISNAPWIHMAISRRNIIRLLRNLPVIQTKVFYVILCVSQKHTHTHFGENTVFRT